MPLLAAILDLFPSFQPGERLVNGGELQQQANLLFSAKTGITALAGGGQAGATVLGARFNRVDTCVTNSDSVMLPQAVPGRKCYVYNNTGQTLAVFGQAQNPNTGVGDTVAAFNSNTQQPTATGVTQATTIERPYTCYVAGQWKQGGN